MGGAVGLVFANALGWRQQASLIEAAAATLYPGLPLCSCGQTLPRLLRPLLKDVYGLGFPRRLNWMTAAEVMSTRIGRWMLDGHDFERTIFLGGGTAGLAAHLPPSVPAVLVTDMTNALAARKFGARFSARDIRVERDLIGRFRKVFAMNTECAASLISEYGLAAGRVEIFPPPAEALPLAEKAAGGLPVIGFVGTDFDRKGGQDLLAVYQASFARRARLVIVSANAPRPLAVPGVTVCYGLPHAEVVRKVLPSLDVFCLPTHQDCSPLAIAEALMAGLPVITTDIAGVSDLVAHERTGLLVRPRNCDDLTRALERLVDDAPLRQRWGVAARDYAIRTFEVGRATRRLLDAAGFQPLALAK